MTLLSISREELIFRLVLAIVLGSVIGMERERGERSAGMRTHAMVALGSAAFMLVSAYGMTALAAGSISPNAQSALRLDPFRIAAQVVSGIGFLGAGMIFFRREIVRGLTTAAGLWVVAALGLAVGAGMYLLSIGVTVGCLLILAVFKPVEERLFRRPERMVIHVRPQPSQLPAIREAFDENGVRLTRLTLVAGEKTKSESIKAEYESTEERNIEHLVESLRAVPGFLCVDQVVLQFHAHSRDDEDTEDGTSDYSSYDQDEEEVEAVPAIRLG